MMKHHYVRWDKGYAHCYYCPCQVERRAGFMNSDSPHVHEMCQILDDTEVFLYGLMVG